MDFTKRKRLFNRRTLIFILCIGALASLVITVNAAGDKAGSIYPTNENGQTYGAVTSDYTGQPDLILARGIADDGKNEVTGYVLKSDLEGNGPLPKPQTPEEVLIYME
jgi:hypothetical protein